MPVEVVAVPPEIVSMRVPRSPEHVPAVLVLQSLNVTVVASSGAPVRMPVKVAVSTWAQAWAVLTVGLGFVSLFVIVQTALSPFARVIVLLTTAPPPFFTQLSVEPLV